MLTGFDANLKDQVEANGDFALVLGKSTDKGVLAMNSTKGPLADKRVRQAIRQAIDKKSIVEALGAGQTLYGPIPELDPGYEDLTGIYPYDLDKAKSLMSEAGYSESKPLQLPESWQEMLRRNWRSSPMWNRKTSKRWEPS